MPRLFVDCDDTLVLWKTERAGQDKALWVRNAEWELNQPLIAQIGCFLDKHKEYSLVVWSNGGDDYAGRWAERARLCERFHPLILSKNTRVPENHDICIDDIDLWLRDTRVRVEHPDLFTRRCPLCRPDGS